MSLDTPAFIPATPPPAAAIPNGLSQELGKDLLTTFEDIAFGAKPTDAQRENANVDANSAMGAMLKYGSEGVKRFNALRVLERRHAQAHGGGDMHIDDLDFFTLTMTCCQISLRELFRKEFSTVHGVLRPSIVILLFGS